MGERSAIAWTDATWNPWQGCHKVSLGCRECYMFREKRAYGQDPDVVVRSKPHTFNMPLRLKTPMRVFTCSWSDFFIEEADPWRDEAFEIIALTPHLTYQILTKRIDRAKSYIYDDSRLYERWQMRGRIAVDEAHERLIRWPLSNVHLIVSVENQATADDRIPLLLETPAAVRGVSYEPALGPVDFSKWLDRSRPAVGISWVIIGGESGPRARPFDLAWARSTIAQCREAGVACFMKQIGARPVLGPVEPGAEAFDLRAHSTKLHARAGADPEEWPRDLRVQEFPR